jgi:hypothetical protein
MDVSIILIATVFGAPFLLMLIAICTILGIQLGANDG